MPLQRDSVTTYIIFILPLFVLALIAAFNHFTTTSDMATKPSNHNLNGLSHYMFSHSEQHQCGHFYRPSYLNVANWLTSPL